MNIYVGNLSWDTTEDHLRTAFEAYGQVESVSIITDKYSGRSRGFGFVEMPVLSEGQAAVKELDGKELDGRSLKVNPARAKEDRGGGGGDRNRGGGGGGGRRGW